MKNLQTAAFMVALLLIAASCKNDNVDPSAETYPNYTQLKVGNYWIYEIYNVDSLGNGSSTGFTDSCYIAKDSVIRGNTYYYLTDPGFHYSTIGNRWLRDSADCLVDTSGRLLFSSQNFSSILDRYTHMYDGPGSDTLGVSITRMSDINASCTVPAGTFSTLNSKITYLIYPPYDPIGNRRYLNRRFAQHIGLITETHPFFQLLLTSMEKRLLRYHLN